MPRKQKQKQTQAQNVRVIINTPAAPKRRRRAAPRRKAAVFEPSLERYLPPPTIIVNTPQASKPAPEPAKAAADTFNADFVSGFTRTMADLYPFSVRAIAEPVGAFGSSGYPQEFGDNMQQTHTHLEDSLSNIRQSAKPLAKSAKSDFSPIPAVPDMFREVPSEPQSPVFGADLAEAGPRLDTNTKMPGHLRFGEEEQPRPNRPKIVVAYEDMTDAEIQSMSDSDRRQELYQYSAEVLNEILWEAQKVAKREEKRLGVRRESASATAPNYEKRKSAPAIIKLETLLKRRFNLK
jgi:hypothetical protein